MVACGRTMALIPLQLKRAVWGNAGQRFYMLHLTSLPKRQFVFNTLKQNEWMNRRSVGKWQCQPSLSTTAKIWQPRQNHDGKNSEWWPSQQLPWFSSVFGFPVRGLTWFLSLQQSCPDSPLCQGKPKSYVTKPNGFGPDLGHWMWARASHADRYADTPVPL